MVLLAMAAGCASVGCSVQPLKPTKALRCEMPV
jgi:hypothetical protein